MMVFMRALAPLLLFGPRKEWSCNITPFSCMWLEERKLTIEATINLRDESKANRTKKYRKSAFFFKKEVLIAAFCLHG